MLAAKDEADTPKVTLSSDSPSVGAVDYYSKQNDEGRIDFLREIQHGTFYSYL